MHVSATKPLLPCADAYEAEAEAAILAVEDAYSFVLASRSKGEAIGACHFQGDNLAIVAYFAGRFRGLGFRAGGIGV